MHKFSGVCIIISREWIEKKQPAVGMAPICRLFRYLKQYRVTLW